ncbi:MAG: hypothetical protein JXA20_06785 [Spirochaetes bacterium]|nr:hypothetical protein [Spirochaetota bacterium]
MTQEEGMPVTGDTAAPAAEQAGTPGGPAMPVGEEKPTSIPKVMGILLVVFGSIYLVASLFSAISTLVSSAFITTIFGLGSTISGAAPPDLAGAVDAMRGVYIVQGLEGLAKAALSAVALAAGIGLMRYAAWGVRLSFWWGVSALAYLVADTGIYIGFIMPATVRFMAIIAGRIGQAVHAPSLGLIGGSMAGMGASGILSVNSLMAVMPVLTLVFMTREQVQKACGAILFRR